MEKRYYFNKNKEYYNWLLCSWYLVISGKERFSYDAFWYVDTKAYKYSQHSQEKWLLLLYLFLAQEILVSSISSSGGGSGSPTNTITASAAASNASSSSSTSSIRSSNSSISNKLITEQQSKPSSR